MARPARVVLKVRRVILDPWARLARKVSRVRPARLVRKVCKVHPDRRATRVRRASADPQAPKGCKALRDRLAAVPVVASSGNT